MSEDLKVLTTKLDKNNQLLGHIYLELTKLNKFCDEVKKKWRTH